MTTPAEAQITEYVSHASFEQFASFVRESIEAVEASVETLKQEVETQIVTVKKESVEAAQKAVEERFHVERAQRQSDIEALNKEFDGQANAIPNWTGWTETEVLAWFDANVTNLLPAANLVAANTIMTNMATAQRAMARMLVALRNKEWPDLQT